MFPEEEKKSSASNQMIRKENMIIERQNKINTHIGLNPVSP
jgi:hypothetical protein